MKIHKTIMRMSVTLSVLLLAAGTLLNPPAATAQIPAQTGTPAESLPPPTSGPPTEHPLPLQTSTSTLEPYPPPTTEPPPADDAAQRPLVVLHSYSPSSIDIAPGKQFTIEISLINKGQEKANNIVAVMSGTDFFPGETGGVVAVGDLDPGQKRKFLQPLTTAVDIWSKYFVTLELTINYTDAGGGAYSERFVISYPINWGKIIVPTNTPQPTATPTPFLRPQLVITAYQTDVAQLNPGGQFRLELSVQNLGQTHARQVTMIVGGGGVSGDGPSETVLPPGGVSGGGSDVSNFAPLGSSNIKSLGDLAPGASLTARQELIVNVSTNPGAYPLKVTFTYLDDSNRVFTDDQIITLLVHSPPQVEISFYRDPGILVAGQPNLLPLQIVNIGKKTAILGNMQVTSEAAEFSNNVILVGTLDVGGYFTMDATMTPLSPGELTLDISVRYTDDFNQPQLISRTLTVQVEEIPVFEPEPGVPGTPGEPGEEGPIGPTGESFWSKVARFFRGLIGLDSGIIQPQQPVIDGPAPEFEEPVIIPGKG